VLGLVLAAPSASAHEVRPALLALRETEAGLWDVEWRVPARGPERLALSVVLPPACAQVAAPTGGPVAGMHVERWRVRCAGGLAGGTVAIAGLERTVTDVLVRITQAGGATQTARVLPARPSLLVARAPRAREVASTYLALGVEHILLGADHLLFVLALLLLVEGTGRLVRAITAFTAAHSLTLAAATLGWVHVPSAPVEATIALSIVFLAREITLARSGRPGLAQRRPWIVAFAFGLLHGLGFAGALAEVGLPAQAIPLALLFFNAGVEAGQLLFLAAALAALALLGRLARGRLRPLDAAWAWRVAVHGIGGIASYWTIERIAGFWS
jgi:hydrogenase/urease accessory protein HupE